MNSILRAIRKYAMFTNDDNVCVALSGGKDSVTLLYMLNYINKYSYLHFNLSAAHVKTDAYDTTVLKDYCSALNVPYFETMLNKKNPGEGKVCSICSRLKRGALSCLLNEHGIKIVAFGHHADDVTETLLMNIFHNRKLGTFSPVVKISETTMRIIRPMIYLDNQTILNIHRRFQLPLLKFECQFAVHNCRLQFRDYIALTREKFSIPDLSRRFVDAVENYDMTNNWKML